MEIETLARDRKKVFGVFVVPLLGGSFAILLTFFLCLAQ